MERKHPFECMCTVTIKIAEDTVEEFSKAGENVKDVHDVSSEGTTSGIVIDTQKGLVLTHASLLYPVTSNIKPIKLKQLKQSGIVHGNIFTEDAEIAVLLQNYSINSKKESDSIIKQNYNPAALKCNLNEESAVFSHSAKLKSVFECKSLKRTLHRMMPSDTWQFVDGLPCDTGNTENQSKTSKSEKEEEMFYHLLPCFVLLQLNDWSPFEIDLRIRRGLDSHIGDPVEICATPFGGLNPDVFMNSRSRGIISNVAGPRNVLLLTDARCVPGSEGGGLFHCQGKQRILTGMIIASLCWKNNEWVGLTMACAISELLGDLEGVLLDMPDSYKTSLIQNYSFDSVVSRFLSQVVLVQVGNTWGSGVIISPTRGIVFTCSHVLKGSKHMAVKLQLRNEKDNEIHNGKVIYKCPDSQQFDLGVVKVTTDAMDFLRNTRTCTFSTDVKEGEMVYVIGHAVFGADLDLSPTVTMGIVSKINRVAGIPVIIQTTCAVHAGASGGAVINQQGELIAIVVCNSKDTQSGACYPHVNMCIPIATVKPIIRQYLNTGDPSILKGLHITSKAVQQLWRLGSQGKWSHLTRKCVFRDFRPAKPPVPQRVPSGNNRLKPKGAPLRAFHPNSSPVYKTQSDSALSASVRNLTINDNKLGSPAKRTVFGRGSGNQSVKSLTDVASLLQSEAVKNVVVVAGAGISTPSGIPDFRSPGTGLYDNLQQYNIPYPEAIFDIDYFHQNPRPFFTLAKELYPSGKYRPNYIHYFARLLHNKEMLLRMYTQNIDGLERLAGVPAEKLVEAHGTFATATCTICRHKVEGSEIKDKIFSDKLPRCPTRGCVGIMKPDIVFFGEDLPRQFYSYMKDMLQTDLVLVMGTSLEVQPFAGIIDTVRFQIPRVLFNRDVVGPFRYSRRTNDLVSTGDLITGMQKFVTMIGWKDEMVELITKEEGEFKVPPPNNNRQNGNNTTQKNNQKNYNNILYGQNSRVQYYRFRDSDSSSESETESDTSSSSDSSVEVKKNRKPVVKKGSSNSLNNGNQKGGNLRNGFRTRSAKTDPNSRKIHTGVDKTVKGGNDGGNLTGRSVKSESGMHGSITKRRLENKLKINSKTNIDEIEKVERDKVLRKYGINPNSKSPYANIDKSIVKPDKTFKINETHVKKSSPEEKGEVGSEQTIETQIEREKHSENNMVLTREKPIESLLSSRKSLTQKSEGKPKFYIGDPSEIEPEPLNETESIQQHERNEDGKRLESKNTEAGVENKINDEKALSVKENVTKDQERLNKDLDDKMEKVSKILNDAVDKNNKIVSANHNLPPPTDYKDKISLLRKLAARQRDQDRIQRMKKLENPERPKEMNTLNTKPYGFSVQLKGPLQQGVGPFQRTNVRTLNSSLDRSDTMFRSGSADLPKIYYRHRLQSSGMAKYDPRIFGFKAPNDPFSDENESSSEDSR